MQINLPDFTNTSVQSLLNKEEIVLETIKQIMKDFGMFGVEISFSGSLDNAYDELLRQLVIQIDHLLSTDATRLWSVLYQVDISNRDIEKTSALKPDYTPVEVIAHQVIERDLKKVLTRIYYRNNS